MADPEKFSIQPDTWMNPVKICDFSFLQFGGTVSSYPPLKTSGNSILFSPLDTEFLSQADAQTGNPRGKDS
jgi:hypothetical protein